MALIVVGISTSNWSNWGLHFSKSISTIRSLFFFGFIGAWRALLKLELREKFSTDEVVWIEASLTIQGCSSGFTRNASKKVWCQTWTRTNLKNLNKSTTSCTCLLHFRPILHDTMFDLGPVCKSRYEHCTSQNMLEFHDSWSTHGIRMLCQLTLCWLLAESLRNECHQRGDQGQQIDTRVVRKRSQTSHCMYVCVCVCVCGCVECHVAKKNFVHSKLSYSGKQTAIKNTEKDWINFRIHGWDASWIWQRQHATFCHCFLSQIAFPLVSSWKNQGPWWVNNIAISVKWQQAHVLASSRHASAFRPRLGKCIEALLHQQCQPEISSQWLPL